MPGDQKKPLATQLWNLANTLPGKMIASANRDYILGSIFYKYLSERTKETDSEDDLHNLFEALDLTSTKQGRTEAAKNQIIAKVLAHLDKIDFHLADGSRDVLGDAYEYLIGQFASGAGKKAGEFYTPQEVRKGLAR